MRRKVDEKAAIDFLVNLSKQEGPKVKSSILEFDNGSIYKLGKLDRASRSHNPPAMSGDAAVYRAHDLMNRRTREMYANVSPVKRTIDVLRDLIVGSGINTYADPIDYSFGWDLKRRATEINRALDYALEADEKFIDWASDPKQCDVEGCLTWFEAMALLISEPSTVGDIFLVFTTPRVPSGQTPFKFQLLEREQLDTTKDRHETRDGNRILNGIEFDKRGYEVGAWFYDVHPNDVTQFSTQSRYIPSSQYIHYFKKSRPSQHIGATWLHAQGQTMLSRNQYVETELRTAVKQALFLLAHHSDDPESMDIGTEPDDGDQSGFDVALGNNPIAATIGKNDKLELIESTRPNPNAEAFFRVLDHDYASAANISYYSLTGRFDETNYGGFRGAINLEDAQMEPIRNALALKAVLPVRKLWNDLSVATGVITTVTPSEYRREARRYSRFDCIGPGRALVDSEKENSANIDKLRAGIATLKFVCAQEGEHWIRVFRQRKLETMLGEALGLTLDFSKGGGGGAKKEPTTPAPQSIFST